MQTLEVKQQTKTMVDDLKAICALYGLGGSPGEYKIITETFLYKYLNDKFIHEVRLAEAIYLEMDAAEVDTAIAMLSQDDYEMLLLNLPASTARMKREHAISYLFNRRNQDDFHTLFDETLVDIANYNIDIFSVQSGGQSKIRLFDPISQYVIESDKKDDFCRALIDKLANFSFAHVFEQKYDFFADIFEYLIKDYNKDFGKYAEYYTPHSIASIIAKIMVPGEVKNVTVYEMIIPKLIQFNDYKRAVA